MIYAFNSSNTSAPDLILNPFILLACALHPRCKNNSHPSFGRNLFPQALVITTLFDDISCTAVEKAHLARMRSGSFIPDLLDQSDAACNLIGPDRTEGRGFQLEIWRGRVRAPAGEEALLVVQGEERGEGVKRLAGRRRSR